MKTLASELANLVIARANCIKSGNDEWRDRHEQRADELCREMLPHGNGIDGNHATIDWDASSDRRLVLAPADFHHMDENGTYDGWTEHRVIVTPSLAFGIDVRVTGRDRNSIKEYLAEQFDYALRTEIA